MKSIGSFKRALGEIRSLMARRKHAEALAHVTALLGDWENQPALLVLRAELIQLQDENGPPLDAAGDALKRAVALNDRNADAWLELGHFQFAVNDDAKTAEKSFAAAVAASSESLIAALVARAGALEEMGRTRDAFDCLSVARYLQGAMPNKNGSAEGEASLFDRWESIVGNA
jgi:tetratricopeptide (TPR) repeat protein